MNKLMENFGNELVTIMTVKEGVLATAQGLLIDADDFFVYLSQENSGEIDLILSIKDICAIKRFEDTPEVVDPDNEKKSKTYEDALLRVLKNDDNDDGNLQ